jgi:hypothetical protein
MALLPVRRRLPKRRLFSEAGDADLLAVLLRLVGKSLVL